MKKDDLGIIVFAIACAYWGTKSVVEYVADACVQVISSVTTAAPWIGVVAIVSIGLMVLRSKIDDAFNLVGAVGSLFRK